MPHVPVDLVDAYRREVARRLDAITASAHDGGLDAAVDLLATAIAAGGVVHAFGTGHSEAFAMEVAGRAGGLVPTNRIALRDAVLHGDHGLAELAGDPPLERDPAIAADVLATATLQEHDVLVVASSSGVNGSVVGLALLARERGLPVIAVTSLEHSAAVEPKHPSGKRLSDVADVVLDNRAPYGDATLVGLDGLGGPDGVAVGAVSSITAAYLAQLLTVGTVAALIERGVDPPLYVSANVPGGDEHNAVLEARYAGRIRRGG